MPRPRKPSLTDEEFQWVLARQALFRGRKGAGMDTLAHDLWQRRLAGRTTPSIVAAEKVSASWLRSQIQSHKNRIPHKPVAAYREPESHNNSIVDGGTVNRVSSLSESGGQVAGVRESEAAATAGNEEVAKGVDA